MSLCAVAYVWHAVVCSKLVKEDKRVIEATADGASLPNPFKLDAAHIFKAKDVIAQFNKEILNTDLASFALTDVSPMEPLTEFYFIAWPNKQYEVSDPQVMSADVAAVPARPRSDDYVC